MITAGNLAGYAVASFVLIAIPGPSVLFVIGRALSLGRGPAIASVAGNAVGVYVVAVLVAFGLGTLVQRSDAAFLAIKLVGGLYLMWLGIQAIRHRHDLAAALKARSALSNASQDDRVKQAAAVSRDVAARAEEASKTVTRRVEQEDAWDELRADVQLLTEIARAHHALIVDLLDRVAELEARADAGHDN
jgi:hypothetical protein